MGEADRYQDYRKVKKHPFSIGQDNNAVMAIFILNVVFFLILLFLKVGYAFYQRPDAMYYSEVVPNFELPASLGELARRPWTILTYMFSDVGIALFRIISNMLWLWAFGYILQELAGNDKVLPVYIYGGIAGGIVFIAASNLLPQLKPFVGNTSLLGANAATMAVAMATTTLSPGYRFFTQIRGGIPIWVLMAIYVFIDFAGVATSGAAFSLSHLGGAIAGFLFVVLLKRGIDASAWMNKSYNWFIHLFTPKKNTGNRSVKEKIFYNTGNRSPYNKTSIITQQRIDEILDKINLKGYQYLTDEEKQILRKASEEDNP